MTEICDFLFSAAAILKIGREILSPEISTLRNFLRHLGALRSMCTKKNSPIIFFPDFLTEHLTAPNYKYVRDVIIRAPINPEVHRQLTSSVWYWKLRYCDARQNCMAICMLA